MAAGKQASRREGRQGGREAPQHHGRCSHRQISQERHPAELQIRAVPHLYSWTWARPIARKAVRTRTKASHMPPGVCRLGGAGGGAEERRASIQPVLRWRTGGHRSPSRHAHHPRPSRCPPHLLHKGKLPAHGCQPGDDPVDVCGVCEAGLEAVGVVACFEGLVDSPEALQQENEAPDAEGPARGGQRHGELGRHLCSSRVGRLGEIRRLGRVGLVLPAAAAAAAAAGRPPTRVGGAQPARVGSHIDSNEDDEG